MQIFIRVLDGSTRVVQAQSGHLVAELKDALQAREGVPRACQGLVCCGRQLEDDRTLSSYGLEDAATVHLILRLRGGKGGFGALLRGAGRAALTDNFDACRDLSGRRLRHVNADKKLAEWAAQAKERELEKLAAKHIKEQQRLARRRAKAEVDMDDVRDEQAAALADVDDAVVSGLKRGPPDAGAGPEPKRSRFQAPFPDIGASSLGSEAASESESEEEIEPVDAKLAGLDTAEPRLVWDGKPAAEASSLPSSRAGVAGGMGGARSSSGSEQDRVRLGAMETGAATAESLMRLASSGSVLGRTLSLRESRGSAPASPAPPGPDEASLTIVASAAVAGARAVSVASTVASSPALAAPHTAAPPATIAGATADPAAGLGAGAEAHTDAEAVDLKQFGSAGELEALGLERLKLALQAAGLKAGGTLADRAARMFLLRDTPLADIPRKHLAKPGKK